MTTEPKKSVDALIEEAAQWHARLDSGTADIGAFETWRNADPRNAAAFARVLGTAGVIDDNTSEISQKLSIAASRRNLFQAAAAAAGVALLGGGVFWGLRGNRVSAETPVGEQMTRALPDGSRLHINTDSKVQWRIDDTHRDVWLDRGEIALDIPNTAQPLQLHVTGQTVTAISGKLNARIRGGLLDLVVLNGSANVQGNSSAAKVRTVTVSEGQGVFAAASELRMRTMSSDAIQSVSAWQNGDVFFNGEILSAAVEEYNRYLAKKITIGDPSLQGIRLGGRFSNRNPAPFLSSLHDGFGINAIRAQDGSIVLTR